MKMISVLSIGLLIMIAACLCYKVYGVYRLVHPLALEEWDRSDESNTTSVNHFAWSEIVERYVVISDNEIALFDYSSVTSSDKLQLKNYLQDMQKIDPRIYSKAEQMAFWINLYNAITVDLILDAYPIKSIKKLGSSILNEGPWNDDVINIASTPLTLNNIEHGILRELWQDNRVHYVLNCGSIGCPNLFNRAFESNDLSTQLDNAAVVFINHQRGVSFNASGMTLSSIFNWFLTDFGGDEEALLQHLKQYAKPELKQKIISHHGNINYAYDWKLNAFR